MVIICAWPKVGGKKKKKQLLGSKHISKVRSECYYESPDFLEPVKTILHGIRHCMLDLDFPISTLGKLDKPSSKAKQSLAGEGLYRRGVTFKIFNFSNFRNHLLCLSPWYK